MQGSFDEISSEVYQALPPAELDESRAPDYAILTRFTGSHMLRGRIEHAGERWAWHFVLDTDTPHEGCAGVADSYDVARLQMLNKLRSFHVRVSLRSHVRVPLAHYPPR